MDTYFPTEIIIIMIKYTQKELIKYLIKRDYNRTLIKSETNIYLFDWKRLYYSLYRTTKTKAVYQHPKIYENVYLNEIVKTTILKRITEGFDHKIKITNKGLLFVKGSSENGVLGLGICPQKIDKWKLCPFHQKVAYVACGYIHSMLLTEDGDVFVTGSNKYGELGIEMDDDEKEELIIEWRKINMPEKVLQITCGHSHSIVLLGSGKILVTGYNGHGQLGYDDYDDVWRDEHVTEWKETITLSDIKQIKCVKYTSIALTKSGTIFIAGKYASYEEYNQMEMDFFGWREIKMDQKVKQIECSSFNVMILLEDGKALVSHSSYCKDLICVNDWSKVDVAEKIIFIEARSFEFVLLLENGKRVKSN